MAGIGVAVADGSLAGFVFFEHLDHFIGEHHRTEGEVAVGDGLGGAHHVRLHTPMARARPRPGTTKRGDHLVSDQKDAVTRTDFAHAGHERCVRRNNAARAEDRLHDEGRDGVGALEGDFVFESGKAELGQLFRVCLIKRIAIGVGRGGCGDIRVEVARKRCENWRCR